MTFSMIFSAWIIALGELESDLTAMSISWWLMKSSRHIQTTCMTDSTILQANGFYSKKHPKIVICNFIPLISTYIRSQYITISHWYIPLINIDHLDIKCEIPMFPYPHDIPTFQSWQLRRQESRPLSVFERTASEARSRRSTTEVFLKG